MATACTELQVPPPVPISVEAGELSGLMRRLVMVAMRPEGFIPCTPARKAQVGGAGWVCRRVCWDGAALAQLVTTWGGKRSRGCDDVPAFKLGVQCLVKVQVPHV